MQKFSASTHPRGRKIISAHTGHIARWAFVKQTAYGHNKRGSYRPPFYRSGKPVHHPYCSDSRANKDNKSSRILKEKIILPISAKIRTHWARWANVIQAKTAKKSPLENQPYLTKYLFCKPTLFFLRIDTHSKMCRC